MTNSQPDTDPIAASRAEPHEQAQRDRRAWWKRHCCWISWWCCVSFAPSCRYPASRDSCGWSALRPSCSWACDVVSAPPSLATVGSYVVLSALVGPLFGTQILVYGLIGAVYAAAARLRLPSFVAVIFGAIDLRRLHRLHYRRRAADPGRRESAYLGRRADRQDPGPAEDARACRRYRCTSGHSRCIACRSAGSARSSTGASITGSPALIAIVVIYGLINSWAFLFVTREILARVDRDVRG